MRFVLLTGEYPPYPGGVADYTWQVAQGLRKRGASVEVIVFREPRGPVDPAVSFVGPAVHPMSLRRASRMIGARSQDCILLVQYVPQMYGLKGMNLAFVMWLCRLKPRAVWVMFHELYVGAAKGSPWKHRLLASITQNMAQRMAKKADHCFVSIRSFMDLVKKFARSGVQVEWLPVPSNLPTETDMQEVERLRARLSKNGTAPLVGHFGTYGPGIRLLLQGVVEQSRRPHPDWKFVFIGRGSREFLGHLEGQGVLPPGSAAASGELGPAEAACWIKACDVMVQPYPEGVTSRRGSFMASVALGKALVTNLGRHSDEIWRIHIGTAMEVTEKPDAGQLLHAIGRVILDGALRRRLECGATLLYQREFSLDRTLQSLLRANFVLPVQLA